MKILYLGGKTAGLVGLLTLLSKGYRPDVVFYSGDVQGIAEAYDLGYRDEFRTWAGYDLLVSVHGRQIIPKTYLDSLPHGGINLHPCLWKYKGKNPVGRALEAGETKFSVGAHRMTEKVDEGEVLVEKFIDVPIKCKYVDVPIFIPEVYSYLYPLYSIVLSEALDVISSNHPC